MNEVTKTEKKHIPTKFKCVHCLDVFYSKRYKKTFCKCGISHVIQPKFGTPMASVGASLVRAKWERGLH